MRLALSPSVDSVQAVLYLSFRKRYLKPAHKFISEHAGVTTWTASLKQSRSASLKRIDDLRHSYLQTVM